MRRKPIYLTVQSPRYIYIDTHVSAFDPLHNTRSGSVECHGYMHINVASTHTYMHRISCLHFYRYQTLGVQVPGSSLQEISSLVDLPGSDLYMTSTCTTSTGV